MDTDIAKEAENHYPIKLNFSSKVKLFIMHSLRNICCCSFGSKLNPITTNQRLLNLYEKGCNKFETELGIERILKNLRDLNIYNKALLDEST